MATVSNSAGNLNPGFIGRLCCAPPMAEYADKTLYFYTACKNTVRDSLASLHQKEKGTPIGCPFSFSGGGEGPMVYNTISRELLNNAYNPRLCYLSEQAKETMKRKVFAE